jgi:hypothetical protein
MDPLTGPSQVIRIIRKQVTGGNSTDSLQQARVMSPLCPALVECGAVDESVAGNWVDIFKEGIYMLPDYQLANI